MKKNIAIMVLGLLCIASAYAQTNKTYRLAGYELQGQSFAFLNKLSTKDYVVGSVAFDQSAPPGAYPKYLLTKMDINGTPMATLLRDSSTMVERIVETADSGVIVVTDYYDEVMIRKYDNNLVPVWSSFVLKRTPGGASTYYGSIDIEPVLLPNNPPNAPEDYFIIFSEGSSDPNQYQYDEQLSVIRIDFNGNLVWHKIYNDMARSTYDPWVSVVDKGNSLVSFPDPMNPNDKLLALAGTRMLFSPGMSLSLFYMTIDINGTIVSQYKNVINDYAEHYCPDIQYDGDSLVASFTQENGGFPDPTIPSAYSIMKFDNALSGFRARSYWSDCENIPVTIAVSTDDSLYGITDDGSAPMLGPGTDKNYVVGGWVGKCYPQSNNFAWANPAFLKVDKITLDPIQFKRYNVYQEVWASIGSVWNCYHRADNDGYQYLGLDPRFPTASGPETGVRVLVTDPTLSTCGERNFDITYYDLSPVDYSYNYDPVDFNQTTFFPLPEIGVSLTYDDCDMSTKPDYYKTSSVTTTVHNAAQFEVQVVPTLVSNKAGETVECKVKSPAKTKVDIAVYNVLGQVSYQQSYDVKVGDNVLRFDASLLSSGMNIVRVTHGNTIIHSAKVNVLN